MMPQVGAAATVFLEAAYKEKVMKGAATGASVLAALCLGLLPAAAQTFKQQIVGTWTLTSGIEKTADGQTHLAWAAGSLMLDDTGHVAFFVVGKDQPNDNPDPRKPVGPFIAYYGTYTVDEAAKTVTFRPEIVSAPSPLRTVRKQTVSFNGDTMIFTASPIKTPQGEVTPINEWKRAK